jgi:hypothetical protein
MASDRLFGIVMAVFWTGIGLWPLARRQAPRPIPVAAAALFLAIALGRPSILHPLNRLWAALAVLLNRVMNPVVCGLLFYLVITPMGWLRRMSGQDPLRLHPQPGESTYWISREAGAPAPESMRVQF